MTTSVEPEPTDLLKRAYRTITAMQRRLDEASRPEPVAVVGLGCRFPGSVTGADSYWRFLNGGGDAVEEVPASRFDAGLFYDPVRGTPGKSVTRWGGFVSDIDVFDHDFFGISRREALVMDPQQRLALEVAWQALEHARIPASALAGTKTGVFMGASSYDYAAEAPSAPTDITAYTSSGTNHSVIAGRVAYVLDLRGPAIAVDTACSSSLVAIHQACLSLRAGDCDVALAGGVNVVMSPLPAIAFSQFGMMSGDGRARTFDADADGCVRGEGAGLVVLKRLSDARRDGDRVLAVVAGSAVNQDGRSSGFTAPNGAAQRECIQRALSVAGIQPGAVGYVEAHGTGTPLGDPIEVDALSGVYGKGEHTCYLGSAKTNISHLEAAAGVAGFIKVVLSLHHATVAPNLHFSRLNPHIRFDGTTFAVATTPQPWPTTGERAAAVSSFGFSGTNAHIVLRQPEPEPTRAPADPATGAAEGATGTAYHLLPLSARSGSALAQLADRYRSLLADATPEQLAQVCSAAGTSRAHLTHRLALVARSAPDAADLLEGFVEGWPSDRLWSGSGHREDVVFVFTGHGAQSPGMTRGLYESNAVFRDELARCCAVVDDALERPLLSVILAEDADDDTIHRMTYGQPALCAVELALAAMWRTWGVTPAAVVGHSIGEVAAACVAGCLDAADAMRLALERGRLFDTLAAGGAMAALALSEASARQLLTDLPGVVVAAVNSPTAVTVAGTAEAVDAVVARAGAEQVRATRIDVTTAGHSPLVDPLVEPLRAFAATLPTRAPQVPFVSNATGDLVSWQYPLPAGHWAEHLRAPVRFAAGVERLHALGHRTFLEIGPAARLTPAVAETLADASGVVTVSSLHGRQPDALAVRAAAARLYAAGVALDWDGVYAGQPGDVDLPLYPFDRTPCPVTVVARGPNDGSQPAARAATDSARDALHDALYRVEWVPVDDADGPGEPVDVEYRWCEADPQPHGRGRDRQAAGVVAVVAADLEADLRRDVARVADVLDRVSDLVRSAATESDHPPRVWLVTRGAVTAVDGDPAPSVAGSALWGLGRALQQELATVWGGLVDLDPGAEVAEQLAAVSRAVAVAETELCVRGGRLLAARLSPLEPAERPVELAPDGAYLLTGGFGGLAADVARDLVRRGARRLVLVGRTPVPQRSAWAGLDPETPAGRRVALVSELERLGATVTTPALDVSDAAAVAAWVERYRAEQRPPILGVVHTAGTGRVVPLEDLGRGVFAEHLAAKVDGALAVVSALRDDLRFAVLFSSLSATLSSPFTAAYAAANAALDGLAARLRSDGIPCVAVEWGLWDDTGLAASAQRADVALSAGMRALDPQAAAGLTAHLAAGTDPVVTVVDADWGEWGERYRATTGTRILDALVAAPRSRRRRRDGMPDPAVLRTMPRPERVEALVGAMSGVVGRALGTDEPADVDRPLFDLGLDSLLALDLKNELSRETGVSIPIARFLDGASVRQLAELVADGIDTDEEGLPLVRGDRGDDEVARILAAMGTDTGAARG